MDRVNILKTKRMFGASLKGKRKKDEDYIQGLVIKNVEIGILCDGMGGGDDGEIVSKAVSETFAKGIKIVLDKREERWMSKKYRHDTYAKLIKLSHQKVSSISTGKGKSGTTLTSVVITYENKKPKFIDLIHIGDSRCYEIKDSKIELLTADHSVTGDMVKAEYIDIHEISETAGNNSLTRSIGDENESLADILTLEINNQYSYLICCDGVWDPLHKKDGLWVPNEIIDGQKYVDMIVNEALRRGSTDNCSALLIRVDF